MAVNVNRILKGSSGTVYVNGKKLATLTEANAKIKGNFTEHNFCDDVSTYYSFDGWTGDGTIKFKKINSDLWSELCDAYQTGVMPDIKIISRLTDKVTRQVESAAITNINFTEFALFEMKAKEAIESEFPFNFSTYQKLSSIAS